MLLSKDFHHQDFCLFTLKIFLNRNCPLLGMAHEHVLREKRFENQVPNYSEASLGWTRSIGRAKQGSGLGVNTRHSEAQEN